MKAILFNRFRSENTTTSFSGLLAVLPYNTLISHLQRLLWLCLLLKIQLFGFGVCTLYLSKLYLDDVDDVA